MKTVSVKCISCGKSYSFSVTERQLQELNEGEKYIQDILSNFHPADREMFISQICGKCFDKIFPEEEGD